MSLFDKLFGGKTSDKKRDANAFADWLDGVLKTADLTDVIAFNFNLYEGVENTYHVELIGSNKYDSNDSDWACEEVFTTRDNLYISDEVAGKPWGEALEFFKAKVCEYLKNGRNSDKLLASEAVGIGFVNGDLEILYESKINDV
jgi:hypothetical protein